MKNFASLLLLASAAGLVAESEGHAGLVVSLAPVCWMNADLSGGCYGSFAGTRATNNSTDWVQFQIRPTYGTFYAYLNGKYYSCTPYGSADVKALWPSLAAASPFGDFFVQWDAGGACTSATVYASSTYVP
jgi:hypothetical protein